MKRLMGWFECLWNGHQWTVSNRYCTKCGADWWTENGR